VEVVDREKASQRRADAAVDREWASRSECLGAGVEVRDEL
jgi:hypothetical protein